MAMMQEDRNRAEGKLRAAARVATMHFPAGLPPVLYLTDPARTPDPLATARRLPKGWGILMRHYGDQDQIRLKSDLSRICRARNLTLLVSADPELALSIGAHGVHWPFARRTEARRWQGRFSLMTASAHSPQELRELRDAGVDAALLSTAFASDSPSARAPLGAMRFRSLARASRLPVYALGGMDADTASVLAPVAGIAAIGGIEAVFGPRT